MNKNYNEMKNRVNILILAFCLLLPVISVNGQAFPQRTLNREKTADTRVYYSVFVQSFYDSNKDGIGDLQGLISKLDYLKDLGIGGLWLLPVNPSPSYHKYDVTDYEAIHPDYGSMDDYKQLVKEAHKRDMKVLLDLVVNHTSDQHPWFISASHDSKSPYRDYYIWSDDENEFKKEPFHWHQVRNKDGELQNGERYYGFFWWQMPDLNFDNRKVKKKITGIARYWIDEVGVDGFRLDAARHIFPDDELEKTLNWWSYFRKKVNKSGKNPWIVGEVWGPASEIAPYLSHGISAGFNFELSDSLKLSLKEGVDHHVTESLLQAYEKYSRETDSFEDAIFLTNHDMNRIMTELEGNEMAARAAATLLLTLPGNPFIYYGEEIGMFGEKPDEFIREPFIWNIEGEDDGQTSWEIPYASSSKTVKPLSFQYDDSRSLYNTYKKLINLRNESQGLREGGLVPLRTGNNTVIAYYRTADLDHYLVIVNLSNYMQRIPTPSSLDKYDEVFGTYPVFKGGTKEIVLQPHAAFILKRHQ